MRAFTIAVTPLQSSPPSSGQVVSGTVYAPGKVALAGVVVKGMENGATLQSALAAGNVVTFADGSYYFVLAPHTISSSGFASSASTAHTLIPSATSS